MKRSQRDYETVSGTMIQPAACGNKIRRMWRRTCVKMLPNNVNCMANSGLQNSAWTRCCQPLCFNRTNHFARSHVCTAHASQFNGVASSERTSMQEVRVVIGIITHLPLYQYWTTAQLRGSYNVISSALPNIMLNSPPLPLSLSLPLPSPSLSLHPSLSFPSLSPSISPPSPPLSV